ncbi:hypothetical protein B0H11DRAFT_502939 [Mycena galericulata]|nr:hypothetical protein B0H11DRAFT_502939 [Mycena galericulata]
MTSSVKNKIYMSGYWRTSLSVSPRYTMFTRANGFRIVGGTFNVNTHQPATAHNQSNPYPPAICASEIVARLESIERRIADFLGQVQTQETLEVDHADHPCNISTDDVQYAFQMLSTDPSVYDMAGDMAGRDPFAYLGQADNSSTPSSSSSIVRDKFHRETQSTLESSPTSGYATSHSDRPECSSNRFSPLDNWNEPTIGSTIKRRFSDGFVAKRQRKRLEVAPTRAFNVMRQADSPTPEFGLERLPRSLETWAQSERSPRPYGRRPTNRRRRAVRKAFSPDEQIIEDTDSDTFSVGAPVSKSIRRHSFPSVEQRCRGNYCSSC